MIKLALALILLGLATFALTDAPGPCDTDEQCAATWQCRLKPGCDGSPATDPWDFRP